MASNERELVPDQWLSNYGRRRSIFNFYRNVILRDFNVNTSVCYTSENTLYKYGKVKVDLEKEILKVYVLSLVIPSEQYASTVIIDSFMNEMFEVDRETSLVFEVENLEEKLTFQIYILNECRKSLIRRIMKGELKLKGKYCSEIFNHSNSSDDREITTYLIMSDENCDKPFILSNRSWNTRRTIGYCSSGISFLQELICSECNHKVTDLYFQITVSIRSCRRVNQRLNNRWKNLGLI